MNNNSAIEFLKQRIAQAKEELGEASQKRLDAQKLESTLMNEIRGYEYALAGEMRRSGIAVPVPSDAPPAQAALPVSGTESSNGHRSAAGSIFSYIQNAGSRGMTRSEIKNALARDGIKVHKNYPYVVIAKLKESRKVKEEGERLYFQE